VFREVGTPRTHRRFLNRCSRLVSVGSACMHNPSTRHCVLQDCDTV
jgi:hypothetical protein